MRIAAIILLVTLPLGAQLADDVFVACRAGRIAAPSFPSPTEAARPLWRAEGFRTLDEARAFAINVSDAIVTQLSAGARYPYLIVRNTGPFDWTHYLGPTHWPVQTYAADELDLAWSDARIHEATREPWTIVSTGDPRWPVLVVFEASSPCVPPKPHAVRGR